MSLQALPTELDLRIIQLLDLVDMCHVTLVSQYYSEIAHPVLYERITFWNDDGDRIRKLLATFLDHRDLGQFVKYFRLRQDPLGRPTPQARRLCDRMHFETSPVKKTLYDLVRVQAGRMAEVIETISSRCNIVPEHSVAWVSKPFELHPLFDDSLSLLLCLVPNLTELGLELTSTHPLPITLHTISNIDWNLSDAADLRKPFGKLKELCITSGREVGETSRIFCVGIDTGMECVKIRGNRECILRYLPHPPLTNAGSLRHFELDCVDFDPEMMTDAIKSSWLSNLKTFIVQGVGRADSVRTSDGPYLRYDYSLLKQAMSKHLPKLEMFHWTDMAYNYNYLHEELVPFAAFAAFPQLKDLCIDYNLLFESNEVNTPQSELPKLTTLSTVFPAHLQVFGFCGITWSLLQKFHAAYGEDVGSQYLELSLQQIASSSSVKNITSTRELGDWTHYRGNRHQPNDMDAPAVHFLRHVADSLMKRGIYFTCEYRMWSIGEQHRPLVGPGFTTQTGNYDVYSRIMADALGS
ncbi:hypothetical protein CC86DRAFT_413775 [Ophiobolus disseminans]|uniref:F-box domain-containing protein n=1 Tax=Ophiobolus disseminans TaxID=1469910 RepID=A0A6A6ZEB9_9PLEO|nr:hypothetical protein CC86DRAFT_413775 [Ophiobolus disseminans]